VPSLAETMYQQYKEKKDSLVKKNTKEILEKYGNAGAKPSEEALLLGQTEAYVEYDRSGRVIKGQEVKARSRWVSGRCWWAGWVHVHGCLWGGEESGDAPTGGGLCNTEMQACATGGANLWGRSCTLSTRRRSKAWATSRACACSAHW
jgi:hypothetical protein